jgi:co-chaperonin GroES (HSP10)
MKTILDKVIVKEVVEKDGEDTIIVKPDSTQSRIVFGEVVAIGENELEFEIDTKSTVIFPRNKSYEFTLNGEKFLVITKDDVLAIV